MRQITLFSLFLLFSSLTWSQTTLDSIQKLDEVVLSDVKLKRYAKGYKLTVLSDSILRKYKSSLTDILRFNSNIYFKENGYGMVSSPSFRGTNASQTAVIWNGININSQLNGQVDFNTISTVNYDNISIRSGGGSVQYGSGAIGGTIHLSNDLDFKKHFDNRILVAFGSFDTQNMSYNASFGNGTWSANIGAAYVNSENDYRFLGTDLKNENGAFHNLDLSVNVGYVLSKNNVLKLYHQNYSSDRQLSGTTNSPSNSKYEDFNLRTLLEWTRRSASLTSKFKIAHLQEHFKYFGNQDSDAYSFGKVNTFIANYNADVHLSQKLKLNTTVDYNYYKGEGSSFGNPNRQAFSTTAILDYKANNKWNYGFSLRQDFTSGFDSPLVFAFDVAHTISKSYKITVNTSKNYRVPTFNDLYWQPGGNLNLKSETSYQIDLGQNFKTKSIELNLNTFYIKTKDLIQWMPNTSGLWSPDNVAETQNYGLEVSAALEKSIKAHQFKLRLNYAYTVSEDIETKNQLIYVPFHTANINLAYRFKRYSMYYQQIYNGDVFTTADNLSSALYSVDAFNVANVGCNYEILEKENHQIDLGFKLSNLYNQKYQNVAFRPMPNRNFNIQILYKF
ncbi:TonB-dependent receptor [Psychroserpens sp. AS72]|uniref:TonB-dependent receptor plug domain-containing protein n=1 Tax=Psychroserpens sp. AS72 TaxID=3135775 RepID=UPI00317EC436